MSLKNFIKKSIATTMATSILLGNFSMCGMGISTVIAENINAPEIVAELKNEQYVQYNENEENSGIAIQSKLSMYPKQEKDTYLPTESVEVEIELPSINGHVPEKALVAESITIATTGEKINTRVNQNYDSNSGLLTIAYENIPNEEGNIYSEYKENTKDEFEIIYIYPAGAYTENEEELKLKYSVDAEMTFRTENGSVTSQNTETIELTEKENRGDITKFSVTELKEKIYKGFMYSNVENKTNYDTEYRTVSTFAVLNSSITNETVMKLKDSKFVLNDEEESEISSDEKIVYTETKISKYEFDKILGQDGFIEIYKDEEVIATVKYLDTEEQGKKLAVIYSAGNTSIIENDDIVINYSEELTNLKIKISKPITEGFIHFENKNVIKASNEYGCKVEEIDAILTKSIVNEYEEDKIIELSEPKTKISVSSSNSNFSTLKNNTTTLTIKLDDTNASTKLFNNPILTIKLPEGLVSGNVSSPRITNGNGLEIKGKPTLGEDKNTIIVELSGKQTSYDLNNVSGGTTIVMDIENIDYADILASHSDKIEVECMQGTEKTVSSCNVNIVSKAGLLILSKTTGYDKENSVTTNMDSSIKEINIAHSDNKKEVSQTITLVNNYDEDLTNVQIIGRIGLSNDDIYSTFDTNLTKEITCTKQNVKIYYSTNKNATYEDNSWVEEFTTDAKSYKIVLKDNKLNNNDNIQIDIKVQLPENLDYNQISNLRTEVKYKYNNGIRNDVSTIAFKTEQIVNTLENTTNTTNYLNIENYLEVGGTKVDDKTVVYKGQVLKYRTAIQNNTTKVIKDIVINGTIPEGTVYTKMKKDAYFIEDENWFDEDSSINHVKTNSITLNPNDVYVFEYEVRVKDAQVKQIKQDTTISINGETNYQKTLTNIVEDSSLQVNIKPLFPDNKPIYTGETVEVSIQVKNLTSDIIKGNIELNISKYDSIGDIKYFIYVSEEGQEGLVEKTINKDDKINIYDNDVIYIKATFEVNDMEDVNFKNGTLNINGTFKVNNKTYTSNTLSQEVIQTKQFITHSLKGYINDQEIENGATIQDKSEITYKIEIANNGQVDADYIDIKSELPEGLVAKHIKYTQYESLEIGYTTKEIDEEMDDESSINLNEYLPSGKTLTIYLTCYLDNYDISEITNKVEIRIDDGENLVEELKYIIDRQVETEEPEDPIENEEEPEDKPGDKPEEKPEDKPNDENEENNTDKQDKPSQEEIKTTYNISGIAWLDSNKNGQRDIDEKLMDSVVVTLVSKDTGDIVTDEAGNKITTITNSNGEYKFENVEKGTYLVIFEFDTNTYTVTTYKKDEVENHLNSDAIITTLTINGEKKLAGITDNISLNQNEENIDIGLIENATFDLSLDKQITKINVINSQGTQEFTYEEGHTAKVDLVAKYINSASVVVNYKFTITNNGDTVGYVDSLVDNLPSGLEFSSELNKDWYVGSDGQLYTVALSGIAIKPGESTQIELILTKNMTEENTGVFSNNAELDKISNLENIEEKEEAIENNKSSADLFISIKTGSPLLYTGITLACIAIIGVGAYIIKKKVLNKVI